MSAPTIRIVKGDHDERPEIQVTHDLHTTVDRAIAALRDDGQTYQRGGVLVHVTTRRHKGTTHHISVMHPSHLRVRLAASAVFKKLDMRSATWKRMMCADDVVNGVFHRDEWGGVRELAGVTDVPTMRPDGTVLQSFGYDKATGMLYYPLDAKSVVEIAESPTREDAMAAATKLLNIVSDFPFQEQVHRSVWLSALLTVLVRPMIEGPCPLFGIDASTRGSGKSMLVDIISVVATGSVAARTTLPRDDEEFRKRVTAMLLAGDPLVMLDNVTRRLGGDAIDALMTSVLWRDRLLGSTKQVTVRNDAVWLVTANNLWLGGDMARRTLLCRLEPEEMRPEDRTKFRIKDIVAWSHRHRNDIVASALTIMRAWVVAGRPQTGESWGSYEGWARTVGAAVAWLGLPSPLTARASLSEERDSSMAVLCALVRAIGAMQRGQHGVSTRELFVASYPPRDAQPATGYAAGLRDTLDEFMPGKGPMDVHRLGCAIRAAVGRPSPVGRIVAGKRIENASRWIAEPRKGVVADPSADSDDSTAGVTDAVDGASGSDAQGSLEIDT